MLDGSISVNDLIALSGILLTTFVGSITGVWSFSSWVNRQFRDTRNLIYDEFAKLAKKLEYHEEHDDKRFSEIKNDVWLIRLRQAAKDGISESEEKN